MGKKKPKFIQREEKVYSLCIIHPTTASPQGDQAVNGWNGKVKIKKCNRNGNRNQAGFHVSPTGAKLLNVFAQSEKMWSL